MTNRYYALLTRISVDLHFPALRSVGTAIEAWTGPTGASKDFELIGTCVEVKTQRVAAKPFVAISSVPITNFTFGIKALNKKKK